MADNEASARASYFCAVNKPTIKIMRFNVATSTARIAFGALFIALLSPLAGNAQPVAPTAPIEVAVYPAITPLKLWVVLTKPATDRPTRIELLNAQNQTLAVTTLSKKEERVRQLFDLSDMTDGVYVIRVVTGKEVLQKTVEVKTPALREQQPQRQLTLAIDKAVAGR